MQFPQKRLLISVYILSFLSNDKLCAIYIYFNFCIEHVFGEIPVIQKLPGSSGVGGGATSRKVAVSIPDGVIGIFH